MPILLKLPAASHEELLGLGSGSCRRLEAGVDSLIAVHAGGRLQLFLNRCPHRGTELDWSPGALRAPDGYHLQCATHGALFDPATGRCVSGPCVGQYLERIALEGARPES